jgi:hypothetical protein
MLISTGRQIITLASASTTYAGVWRATAWASTLVHAFALSVCVRGPFTCGSVTNGVAVVAKWAAKMIKEVSATGVALLDALRLTRVADTVCLRVRKS